MLIKYCQILEGYIRLSSGTGFYSLGHPRSCSGSMTAWSWSPAIRSFVSLSGLNSYATVLSRISSSNCLGLVVKPGQACGLNPVVSH